MVCSNIRQWGAARARKQGRRLDAPGPLSVDGVEDLKDAAHTAPTVVSMTAAQQTLANRRCSVMRGWQQAGASSRRKHCMHSGRHFIQPLEGRRPIIVMRAQPCSSPTRS